MDALASHFFLSVLIAIITGATFILTMRGAYQQELNQRGSTMVHFVSLQAQFPLLVRDWTDLRRLAEQTAALDEVLFIEIENNNCEGIRLARGGFSESDIPPCVTQNKAATQVRRVETQSHSATFLEASHPVDGPDSSLLYGVNESSAAGAPLGYVRIGLSVARARSNAFVGIRRAVVVWIACLVFIVGIALLKLRKALAPAHELAEFAASIDQGSLERRAHVSGYAEIAAVAESFNRMLDRLAATLVSKNLAEQASKAKGQFLANVSHELRTPLNAIIGYSEMLTEECEDRGLDNFLPDLRKIRNSGKMLLDLMNDLLDYSKAESGRMQMVPQTVGVSGIMQEVADTVEPMARANRNQVMLEKTAQSLEIYADPLRFRQSLLNLASNACKFTENGTVTLHARPVTRHGRNWCEIVVEDTGIGIPSEKICDLFEAFVQLEPSHIRKYGGTGLGLAISRKFCRMMGGDIAVESVLGKGSTFTICLPVQGAIQASPDFAETI